MRAIAVLGLTLLVALLGGGWLAMRGGARPDEGVWVPGPELPVDRTVTAAELAEPPVALDPATPEVEVQPRPRVRTRTVLFGSCRDADTGRGIGDVLVNLARGELHIASARSTAEGRFEIQVPLTWTDEGNVQTTDLDGAQVYAMPPRGWVPPPRPVYLKSAQALGDGPIEIELQHGTSMPVQGIVLDRETGEGVREVTVELSMDTPRYHERVVTDLAGNFSTLRAFPAGKVTAELFDVPLPGKPEPLGQRSFDHLKAGRVSERWEIEVSIGPTYHVEATAPGFRSEGWQARLTSAGSQGPGQALILVLGNDMRVLRTDESRAALRAAASLQPARSGLKAVSTASSPGVWEPVPLRAGNPRWVRYPRSQRFKPRDTVLEVWNHDLGWRGTVPVDSTSGVHPSNLLVELVPYSSLEGSVTDTSGVPVPAGIVTLLPAGNRIAPPEASTRLVRGHFLFDDVQPGTWLVQVCPEGHGGVEQEVRLEPGYQHLPLIALPAPPAGNVAGALYAPNALETRAPIVSLSSLDGTRYRDAQAVRRSPTDRASFQFSFEGVPAGSYELSVIDVVARGSSISHVWTPRRLRVIPPTSRARIEARPATNVTNASLQVVDARTDAPIGHSLFFGPRGDLFGECWTPLRFALPAELEPQRIVWHQGYRPHFSARSSTVSRGGSDGPKIALQRGWGSTLYVCSVPEGFKQTQRDTERLLVFLRSHPIPGLKVYMDNDYVRRTDMEGRIDLDGLRPPKGIRVACPGWRPVGFDRLSNEYPLHVLYLEPTD